MSITRNRMTISSGVKFWAIVVAQVLIILGIVAVKSTALSTGRDALVEIAPVDPRDLFRGDYLVYQLKSLTRITGSTIGGEVFEEGQIVYVPLRVSMQHPQIGQPVMELDETRRVSTIEPRDGTVYLRGVVTAFTQNKSAATPAMVGFEPRWFPAELTVSYSIEEFFIPEGSGRDFTFQNKEAMLHISIGPDGTAMIKELYIDGTPWRQL